MKKIDFMYEVEKHELFFYSQLPEYLKRMYCGLQAMKGSYRGVAETSQKYGVHRHTVRRGKKELLEEIVPPVGKIRQKGGGRKKKPLFSRT